MSQPKQGKLSRRISDFKTLSRGDQLREVGNWLLDHAMIIIFLILCIYIQIQRPAFLQFAQQCQQGQELRRPAAARPPKWVGVLHAAHGLRDSQ